MIELSKNFVALNLAKFIYEEEAKVDTNKHAKQADIKEYIFNLYIESLGVVEENDASNYELDLYDLDNDEALPDDNDIKR